MDWLISQRLAIRRTLKGIAAQAETAKAQVRAKVEHVFLKIKQQFGYTKVRYRGLAKNTTCLYVLAGFANLLTCKREIPAGLGSVRLKSGKWSDYRRTRVDKPGFSASFSPAGY